MILTVNYRHRYDNYRRELSTCIFYYGAGGTYHRINNNNVMLT